MIDSRNLMKTGFRCMTDGGLGRRPRRPEFDDDWNPLDNKVYDPSSVRTCRSLSRLRCANSCPCQWMIDRRRNSITTGFQCMTDGRRRRAGPAIRVQRRLDSCTSYDSLRVRLSLQSEFDDEWISMDDRLGLGRRTFLDAERASQSCSALLGVFRLLMTKIGLG